MYKIYKYKLDKINNETQKLKNSTTDKKGGGVGEGEEHLILETFSF